MKKPVKIVSVSRSFRFNQNDLLAVKGELFPTESIFALVDRPENYSTYLYAQPLELLVISQEQFSRIAVARRAEISVISHGNPLQNLQQYIGALASPAGKRLPAFSVGVFGYLGYDCVRYLEKISLPKLPSLTPDACLMVYGLALVLNRRKKVLTLVANEFREGRAGQQKKRMQDRLALMAQQILALKKIPVKKGRSATKVSAALRAGKLTAAFARKTKIIQDHIREGDIFQCVISERYQLPRQDPVKLYQALTQLNPSPYHYCFSFNDLSLVGASPEPLVEINQGTVTSHPIAGTRPRGLNAPADQRFEKQLRSSTKELAEHIMLVDLARNDLGRVCVPGSIKVQELMKTVRYSHVMHLVSIVAGRLKPKQSAWDALFACFPAGTLTGAPKVRAMEIISKLEGQRRGAYGGAVVQYDLRGDLHACITIRSAVIDQKNTYIQAGAGVVADSTPQAEFKEIYRKSLVLRQALATLSAEAAL